MDTQTFIQQVAAGEAAAAQETLNDILSSRAFEALDAKKVEIAKALYGGQAEETVTSDETEVQETEETTEE